MATTPTTRPMMFDNTYKYVEAPAVWWTVLDDIRTRLRCYYIDRQARNSGAHRSRRVGPALSPGGLKDPPWRSQRSRGISSDSQSVVHGQSALLLAPEVAFGCLDGDVADVYLDLLARASTG